MHIRREKRYNLNPDIAFQWLSFILPVCFNPNQRFPVLEFSGQERAAITIMDFLIIFAD